MNFFERQKQARQSTFRLILLFMLAVLCIVAGVNLVVLWLAPGKPALMVFATVLVLAVIGISSLVRIMMLRSGGAEVARAMGATLVPNDTRDPALRRLRNVVEEIAIASSVPMPGVYVMDEEEGINAFAAGYSPSDAVVAVTRGALQRLNREELQGVIAHEFAHILNGDMRLNIRLMGVLFGILVLGIIGRRILMHARGGRDSGIAVVLSIGLGLMILGYSGLFFGRLIKAAVSRSRETLADASAVQFTRQPRGLAGALKKIAGLPSGSRLHNSETEEVSHMLFGEGLNFSNMFATHPPILERIRAIEPSFDPGQLSQLMARWAVQPPRAEDEDRALGFAPDGHRLDAPPPLPQVDAALAISAATIADQIGTPDADDFRRADTIIDQLSDELRTQARDHEHSVAVVLALLLSTDPQQRQTQLTTIAHHLEADTAQAVQTLHPSIAQLHPMLRLPLASLAFPALRRRSRVELVNFLHCCEQLIAGDGRVEFSEYCLGRLMRVQTIEALNPSRRPQHGRRKLTQSAEPVAALLAILAQYGHTDAEGARRAFLTGMAHALPGVSMRYAPPDDFVVALEQAFPQLDDIEPMGKALLVEAMVTAISHDGEVSVAEAELLRTVCAVLHCPLPPLLEH